MALDIINPKDRRFVKSLVFGPAGHGKTRFLGTAQEDERTAPMLLLDFEGGHESLAGLDIDVAEIRAWSDYDEAYELLTSDSKDNVYRSLGIDSASETHIWALLTILDSQAARREGSDNRDPDLLEQKDYGIASTQMRRLLREFRDLPLHVFYTSGSKEVDERGVGKVKVPALAGQMAEEIVHLMSVVGYLAVTEDDEGDTMRSLLLKNYRGFRTKVRTPWDKEVAEAVPDELDHPTVTSLLDALQIPAPKKTRSRKKSTTDKED